MNPHNKPLSRKGLRNQYRALHMQHEHTEQGRQRVRKPGSPSFKQWLRSAESAP